jgi:hypothetical protein
LQDGWGDPAADDAFDNRVTEFDAEETRGLGTRVDAGDDELQLVRDERDRRGLRTDVGGGKAPVTLQQRRDEHDASFRR